MAYCVASLWSAEFDVVQVCYRADARRSLATSSSVRPRTTALGSAASSCKTHVIVPNALLMTAPLNSGWDMHDVVYPQELLVSNRANGYRDLIARI